MKKSAFAVLVGLALCAAPAAVFSAESFPVETSAVAMPGMVGTEEALEMQAESGSTRDKLLLGLRSLMGHGVKADEIRAMKWLKAAADEDSLPAQVTLAAMMAFESDIQDAEGAVALFRKAAEKGSVQAQTELARMLDSGTGTERNPAEAEIWRKKAADEAKKARYLRAWRIAATGSENWQVVASDKTATQNIAIGIDTPRNTGISVDVKAVGRDVNKGSATARTVGAMLLATGNGVKQDTELASKWLLKAAEAGYPQAQAVLGELYQLGWGELKADPQAAAKWMQAAASKGLASAETGWGAMLSDGTGVPQDKEKSLYWISRAAEKNDARAQLMMAMNALNTGKRDEAARWFCRAADNGSDEILSMLGVLYAWGNAAVPGETKKFTEVRQYAQRGEPEAQLMLGVLYGEGWSVERDTELSKKWLDSAVSKPYSEALLPLGLLYAEQGDAVRAKEAFDKASKLKTLAFAEDKGILQLVFISREKLPDVDGALLNTKKTHETRSQAKPAEKKVGTAPPRAEIVQPAVPEKDERQERIEKKLAFLKDAAKKGNPAASLLLSTLLAEGWSLPKDAAAAKALRERTYKKICAMPDAEDGADDSDRYCAFGKDLGVPEKKGTKNANRSGSGVQKK